MPPGCYVVTSRRDQRLLRSYFQRILHFPPYCALGSEMLSPLKTLRQPMSNMAVLTVGTLMVSPLYPAGRGWPVGGPSFKGDHSEGIPIFSAGDDWGHKRVGNAVPSENPT